MISRCLLVAGVLSTGCAHTSMASRVVSLSVADLRAISAAVGQPLMTCRLPRYGVVLPPETVGVVVGRKLSLVPNPWSDLLLFAGPGAYEADLRFEPSRPAPYVVSQSPHGARRCEVELFNRRQVNGRLVDLDWAPIAGAEIRMDESVETTDADGSFQLQFRPPRSSFVEVRLDGVTSALSTTHLFRASALALGPPLDVIVPLSMDESTEGRGASSLRHDELVYLVRSSVATVDLFQNVIHLALWRSAIEQIAAKVPNDGPLRYYLDIGGEVDELVRLQLREVRALLAQLEALPEIPSYTNGPLVDLPAWSEEFVD